MTADSRNDLARLRQLDAQISTLPEGYLSRKTIGGKLRHYRQWRENGKLKSSYVRDCDLEETRAGIELRHALCKERAELERDLLERFRTQPVMAETYLVTYEAPDPLNQKHPHVSLTRLDDYETSVIIGEDLRAMSASVMGWERRDCFSRLKDYLSSKNNDRVCLLFGLRRTGKTTMIRQAIGDMGASELAQTAYIMTSPSDTVAMLGRDLKRLKACGFKTVFIDEATLAQDFIDGSALFSDVYAVQGMRIVLSGTDSLGFWLALNQGLYDRAVAIHTTFVPFAEHARLLGIDDVDDYIRYGGTLKAGEPVGGDTVDARQASFRDSSSTRRYIDTAICHNIQHSLACCEGGSYFRHLYDLYEAGELTSAINRVIEDMNHRFTVSVLTDDFVSHDLRLSARNLRQERDATKRSDALDLVDAQEVTRRLMEILDIRNARLRTVAVDPVHAREIEEYLRALDLIADCPVVTFDPQAPPIEHTLITQPGMRYCQAQALVQSLLEDPLFASVPEQERLFVQERILEEVRGRLLEEIVQLETVRAARPHERVFKLRFEAGEFDMVVYDEITNACRLYEVKHSKAVVAAQYRQLVDEEKCTRTARRFGRIAQRCVLYRGDDLDLPNGICYRNVGAYLKGLGSAVPQPDRCDLP